ncbi:DNA internalization-related competence protein ComEC/Rec2 [bacterium]|nr:DNA internalization-related competence protein ComEC/Rec2 [bacterium]
MSDQQERWLAMQNQIAEASRSGSLFITGTVAETSIYESGSQFIRLSNVSYEKWGRAQILPGNLAVHTSDLQNNLQVGDEIQFTTYLLPVRGPRVLSGFNSQQYQYAQNVFAEAYADSDHITVHQRQTQTFRNIAYWAQAQFKQHFTHGETENSALALLSSIALGIRSGIPSSLRQSLHASGLAHITSISGLHVSLVLFVFAFLLKAIGVRRRWAGILTLVAALLYISIVGLRVPTVRAAMMAFVLIGGYFTERRVDALNSLGLAALCILFYNPSEFWLPSFQLSFTAVLALILFHPMQQWLFQRFPIGLRQIAEGLFASTIVVIALAPFSLYLFHDISFGAVLGNIIAIPLLTLLLPLTYFWLLVSLLPFSFLTDGTGWALMQTCRAMLWTIETASAEGAFQFTLAFPGAACLACGFFALLLFSRPLIEWGRFGSCRIMNLHIALILAIASAFLYGYQLSPNNLRIDYVGLGQGDCILIRAPNNQAVLIDGGPKPFQASRQIRTQLEEFLLSEGIHKIDAIVLTHPQSDHIGALSQVARHFPIGAVFESASDESSKSYMELRAAIDQRNIKRVQFHQGDSFTLDGVEFWALNPPADSRQADINEQSLVLWMKWKEFDALFTGDIGEKTERRMAQQFDHWDVDVLKVAHHGSRYSSSDEFLSEIQPEFAVIQVGRNNYDHPHIEARQRLYAVDAHVLRTDYDGTVSLQTNGDGGYRLYASRSNRLYVFRN